MERFGIMLGKYGRQRNVLHLTFNINKRLRDVTNGWKPQAFVCETNKSRHHAL